MTRRDIRLGDILTDKEILQVQDIWLRDRSQFHARVVAEILEPNLARINKKLGHENDARYLAYALEYIFMNVK